MSATSALVAGGEGQTGRDAGQLQPHREDDRERRGQYEGLRGCHVIVLRTNLGLSSYFEPVSTSRPVGGGILELGVDLVS